MMGRYQGVQLAAQRGAAFVRGHRSPLRRRGRGWRGGLPAAFLGHLAGLPLAQ
jgi:hypothetical protein